MIGVWNGSLGSDGASGGSMAAHVDKLLCIEMVCNG